MDHGVACIDDAVATKGRRDRETTLSDLYGSMRHDGFVASEVNIQAGHGVYGIEQVPLERKNLYFAGYVAFCAVRRRNRPSVVLQRCRDLNGQYLT